MRATPGVIGITCTSTTRGLSPKDRPWHPLLFSTKSRKIINEPSEDALDFPPGSEYAPEPGYEIVPTRRATALVEYLLSLKD